MPKRTIPFIATLFFLVMTLLLLWFYRYVQPSVHYVLIAPKSSDSSTQYEPVRSGSANGAAIFYGTFYRSAFSASRYEIKADDCLVSLEINGKPIALYPPFCDVARNLDVELDAFVRPGRNTVRAQVQNVKDKGGFVFFASRADWRVLLHTHLLAFCVAALLISLCLLRGLFGQDVFLWLMLGLGSYLRVFYWSLTPYWTRGYDTLGHLEYIDFVREFWSIPAAADGWMSYQPPVYYFLVAAIADFFSLLGGSYIPSSVVGSFIGLLLSLVCVYLGVLLCSKVFLAKGAQRLCAGLLAVAPGFVIFAPRINNDVLLLPLLLAATICLFAWWQRQTITSFLLLTALTAVSMLVKFNAAVFAAIVCGAVLVKQGVSREQRLRFLFYFAGGIALLNGPYLGIRALHEGNVLLAGNVSQLDDGLRIPTSASNLLTFSPASIVAEPFTDSRSDELRRAFFLEYLFRSSLYGEFQFGEKALLSAQIVNAATLLILLWSVFGFFYSRSRKDSDEKLFLLFAVAVFSAHALYRLMVPYSCAQDFRYSFLLVLPLLYYFSRGFESKNVFIQTGLYVVAYSFIFASTVFVVIGSFSSMPMWR